MLGELEEVNIKTAAVDHADTGATDIQAEICQGPHCCTLIIGPMNKGATTKYDGDNLSDCKNHALLQDSGDAVTVTFSTTNTDGWRGEFISLSFTNGHIYQCPIDDFIDYDTDAAPTHYASSYVSTCAPLGTTKA